MMLRLLLICGIAAIAAIAADAAPGPTDWPTQRHDNRRSGATAAKLQLPLTPQWSLSLIHI